MFVIHVIRNRVGTNHICALFIYFINLIDTSYNFIFKKYITPNYINRVHKMTCINSFFYIFSCKSLLRKIVKYAPAPILILVVNLFTKILNILSSDYPLVFNWEKLHIGWVRAVQKFWHSKIFDINYDSTSIKGKDLVFQNQNQK